jgi:putative ABC transport system permease protein
MVTQNRPELDVETAELRTSNLPRSSIPYSVKMLWRDRRRFLPALLAIGLSAVLIAVQCGLVLGLVRTTSAPVDFCRAQIWVLPRDAPSLHQNYNLPLAWQSRLDLRPEVARSEPFQTAGARWRPPGRGTTELCMVVGMRLDDDSLGALNVLTPELRAALAEPGAVAIDAWEFPTLGLSGAPYEAGEVNGQEVRLAGLLHGFHGFSFVYVFCSQETLRRLVPAAAENPDAVSCLLARCHRPEDVDQVVAALRRDYPDMGVYSGHELSLKVRSYWLFRSRGGAVLICTMSLALLVGLAVTSETLYAAVLAQSQEFAVLDALGIPTKHVAGLVLSQALWLGVGGALLAVPLAVALARVALRFQTQVALSAEILVFTFALTLGMAFIAGLFSLRPLQRLEPAKLLH